MWNKPSQEKLARLPPLYAYGDVASEDILIHLHFFMGGCSWYVAEFDGEDTFFGYVNLNNPQNGEWGYFSLEELEEIKIHNIEIDTDLDWRPRRFSEIVNP